jgi:hypothetical protein
MSDPEVKSNIFKNQTIKFNRNLVSMIQNIVANDIDITANELVKKVNNDKIFINAFLEENVETRCAGWNKQSFTGSHLGKMLNKYGYKNWKQFKEEVQFYNHKITSIEYLEDNIEVGTLTIDVDEKYHNYHTFALAIGIFTKNSNLGEMGDVEYFKKKLYNALHVPITRITEGSTFNTGRAAEIDREEVKFNKFVKRLRLRFSSIFTDLLRTQLILKNIITPEEWDAYVKNNLYYDFRKDSHFAEYNEAEIMSRRIELASAAAGLGDNYFSESYIKKHFLKLSDEELKEMEIDKESIPDEEVPEEEPMDLGLSDLGPTSPDLTMPQPPPAEIPQETNPVELPDSPEL